jgi:hypothetical protein
MRISAGFTLGLPFSRFYIFDDSDYFYDGNSPSVEQINKNYKKNMNKRLISHYFLGASVSIGFLAF